MRLAVVIVSYNVRELLAACLRSVFGSLAHSPELEAEVWVVDNASVDDSAAMVRQHFPQVRLIASQENLGFAGGNNAALKACGFKSKIQSSKPKHVTRNTDHASRITPPDLVLLLNPDTEVLDDAIGHMARFLAGHPDVGGVGAQLQYPDGRFQHGAFAFPGLMQLWFDFFPPRPRRLLDSRLNGRYPRRWYERGKPFPIGFALGAALMVRREAIEAVGLLDEGYFMYAEEVDWCWRMQRAGWPLYCVPAARVVHHGGASARQFGQQACLDLWRSRHRLYGKFYGPGRRWLACRIVQLGMWTEARRARMAARRGVISEAELHKRLSTYQEICALYRTRSPQHAT
ncbi:MAG: glycosyltransferase family 2 protein [Anaerolineae bacterium]|nr:glycosyltransferase family 2 protein [Anaerolineae bacterium]